MSNPIKDGLAKAVNVMHQTMFDATKGALGGNIGGMPALKLTTVGRKSGKRRSVMLTSPMQKDGDVVLVASYGGDEDHPAWYLNLQENPEVTIQMKGEEYTAEARTATAEERAELWPTITDKYKGYAGYQKLTDREIPVVICSRA